MTSQTLLSQKIINMNMNEKLMERPAGFSWKARGKSFVYAWTGIIQFFRQEPNAQLHLAATVIVVALSVFFGLTKTEAIAVIFSVGLVWVTEMINTAIEKTMDFISIEKHAAIMFIKDVAAGAVLVAAAVAFLVGLIIFIPKFLML